ncbi:aconitate hydratase AcnA [Botrimarina mediterranea]|uniref:Aconitate hydratase n=1 Tax=Botrimarina mediterranea TaxID=2528022 RepID=A0A518K9B1_9BACT|nr:aconitate hydratase AcnA [Botrimarina mediterranea]QDV74381.1 Aconitate hydratase precursor [Botrimarina mediterranea]QDV78977.1 Aconitate hydratase precursor [Planctomycetes bacterium K2D]
MATFDPFSARDTFKAPQGDIGIYRLSKLEEAGLTKVDALPYSIRVLLESVLRNCDGYVVSEQDVKSLAAWADTKGLEPVEVPFTPARVVLQDFTGVPCVVDLAAMRSAMRRLGGDPSKINPLVPVDLVIDHSVQVDHYLGETALDLNIELEFERNAERYEFLRWGQKAFDNFRVVPPGTGIVHQVNLEYLAKCVFVRNDQQGPVAVPDSLVGTDSHTTMIDGLGVVGWGVGGIEAEGVMLGQPIYMLTPEVVGMKLFGKLPAGATATDLVLTVTEILRKEKVVGKFVEFFGPGMSNMGLADRATIANMAPEYGATMGFFPVDDVTLEYLRGTGRTAAEVELVERYCKENQLFRTDDAHEPTFTKVVQLDLASVVPSLAGPKRPQDRVPLSSMKGAFRAALTAPVGPAGFGLDEKALERTATIEEDHHASTITHGAVTIAAITSCTNTSNASVMLAAGLVAKKAAAKGLKAKPWVKTSIAPGSRVVSDYYEKSGLGDELEKVGFYTVGFGCTTCIGNSGPLPEPVANAVVEGDLIVSGVLSGNRNFEGRINPHVKANYLASPPLVVAYALAGTTDIDLTTEPIGQSDAGEDVYLRDIWPTHEEVADVVKTCVLPEMFIEQYEGVWSKNPKWNAIPTSEGELFEWDAASTYIQEPPFLETITPEVKSIEPIVGARCMAMLGDSTTTDHISPAGSIAKDSPAGRFLIEHEVEPRDFNSYGARRGNDRVMTRGTFANIRIRNFLTPDIEGGVTRYLPTGEVMSIYDASMRYQATGTPLVVLAGAEYGTGSSRDWAAKGTFLLGVRAVLATSFERIHRSNLVMMGVLPLEFESGATYQSLGLTGEEVFDIADLSDALQPRQTIAVKATAADGAVKTFDMKCRIDTPVELDYYRHGGILAFVLRKLLKE